MDTFEKIECWAKVWVEQSKIKKIPDWMKKKIPLGVRKDFYIQTVVKAQVNYQKLMLAYAKKHKLDD